MSERTRQIQGDTERRVVRKGANAERQDPEFGADSGFFAQWSRIYLYSE